MLPRQPIPSETIHAARWAVVFASRAAGITLLTIGAYLILKRAAFAIATGQNFDVLTIWNGIGEDHSIYRGLAMIIVATPLVAFARVLARFIARLPDTGCPRCLYERAPGTDRCTECGYEFH